MGRLRELAPGIEWVESAPGAEVEPLDGVSAVVAVGRIGRDVMERGRFGFVQTMGTGYDHIDIPAATELGIRVAHLPAGETGNAESVAEHAVLLMLALSRKLALAQENIRTRHLAQPLGQALLGKTACIVGLGSVGLALAGVLHAFGMKVVATRRNVSRGAPGFVQLYPLERLPEALGVADYVILCARAGDENLRMMNAEKLAAMKPGAILVNVARGSLIDEEALRAALESEHLQGAGLDVFTVEPPEPESILLGMPQVLATPHIAGATDINVERSLQAIAENLRRWERGEVPKFLVNHVDPAILHHRKNR